MMYFLILRHIVVYVNSNYYVCSFARTSQSSARSACCKISSPRDFDSQMTLDICIGPIRSGLTQHRWTNEGTAADIWLIYIPRTGFTDLCPVNRVASFLVGVRNDQTNAFSFFIILLFRYHRGMQELASESAKVTEFWLNIYEDLNFIKIIWHLPFVASPCICETEKNIDNASIVATRVSGVRKPILFSRTELI